MKQHINQCPYCKAVNIKREGRTRTYVQRFRCKDCGRYWQAQYIHQRNFLSLLEQLKQAGFNFKGSLKLEPTGCKNVVWFNGAGREGFFAIRSYEVKTDHSTSLTLAITLDLFELKLTSAAFEHSEAK